MKPLIEQHNVRYPPFEAARWEPNALPVASRNFVIGHYESATEAVKELATRPPAFRLGEDKDWIIERSYLFGGEAFDHEHEQSFQETDDYVRVVNRQRRGWYLIPNPIHHVLRQFINGVVIVLLACLFYLFISPILMLVNLPVYGLETVRWGLLDYPALAVFVVPLIFAPLIVRVVANLMELRRQNNFLKRDLKTPAIEFQRSSVAAEVLELNVAFPEWDLSLIHI